jgi:hypothetical protein
MRKGRGKQVARQAARRGVVHQRAEQERAAWVASQVEPGALHPHGSEPSELDEPGSLRQSPKGQAPERLSTGIVSGEMAPEPHPSLTSVRSRLRGRQKGSRAAGDLAVEDEQA